MTGVFRDRVAPIALATVAVVLAALYFYETGQTIRDDKWIALTLVIGWSLIFVQMASEGPLWSMRGLGLLVTVAGLILFFGRFVIILWDLRDPGPWMDAAYRGAFAVSVPMLIVASAQWFWERNAPRLRRRRM